MRAAGALVPYGHRSGTTVAAPILLHGSQPRPPGPAPALGEHSAQVLADAGYSAEQIAQLTASGVVLQPSP
jgi:crotonobetainyl-CoA:carnitine CoA-transferase CaiB-like acyl-CoA transferase